MKPNGEKYKILTQIIPDIVYEFDPEGKIMFISDAIRELGYSPQELIGTNFKEIVHPDDYESIRRSRILQEYKKEPVPEGMTKCLELKLVVKNQEGVATDCRYTEVHFSAKWEKSAGKEEKEFLGTIGVIKDVTRWKRAEERLKETQTTLRETYEQLVQSEKLAVAGQLASSIAHEVKNLLGILMQDINYLENKLPSGKDIRDVFNMMKSNVQRADRIVRSLVDFSRESQLQIRPTDINSIIDSSLALICYKPQEEKIKIVKDLKEGLPQVLVDNGRMEQVFLNIFLNAIQAMSGKGTLSVRSYATQLSGPNDKTKRGARDYFMSGEKAVIVEIEDTGIGIPAENIEKVFDPFFSTKKVGKESGLGLSVTKKIIEMHKGLIDIESQVGRGTKIIITLKIIQGTSATKAKIMLVDDETDFLKITKLNLEKMYNYQVLALSNARDIVLEVNSFKPDIIILDMLMPAIKGVDACEMLNNDEFGKKIPIIILSAVDSNMDKLEAYRAGVKDYLVKPIELEALIAKIEKVLSSRL